MPTVRSVAQISTNYYKSMLIFNSIGIVLCFHNTTELKKIKNKLKNKLKSNAG